MARNQNRQQIAQRAIKARRPARSGGTSAPRSAAGGARMGLGQNQPARKRRTGVAPGRAIAGPGAALGPGGSAGAMAPSTPAPTPWNAKADQIVAGARRNYLDTNVGFDLSEQQAKQDFGLDPGFNDYKANPFSRAALLQENYLNANRGTMNSAGNQLYAGSTSNALGANRRGYDINRDELTKLYRDSLGEISKGRADAAKQKADEERDAEWERIGAAEGAPLDAESAPGGGGKKAKPKAKPKGGGGAGPSIGRGRRAR